MVSRKQNPLAQFGQEAFDQTREEPKAVAVPKQSATPNQNDIQNKTLNAGMNKGIDVKTGQEVPVIDITASPKGQALQKQNLPAAEQQAALEAQKQQQALLARQQVAAPIAAQVGQNLPTVETPKIGKGIGGAIAEGGLKGLVSGAGTLALKAGQIGGAAGAVAAPATGGLSVPVVAGGAAAAGFVYGVYNELKSNYETDILASNTEYKKSRSQMTAIINAVNSGVEPNTNDAVAIFNLQLAEIDAQERALKAASGGIWDDKTKVAQVAIANFNQYERANMVRELQAAIMSPDPSKVISTPQETETTYG